MNLYLSHNQIAFFVLMAVICTISLLCLQPAQTAPSVPTPTLKGHQPLDKKAGCDNHAHQLAAQHSHSHSEHAFSDKEAVAKMAKSFESAERDAMQQPQKVLHYLGNIQGKKIMDIGAATGYFSVKFAAHGAHVIAADVSDVFQEYLKDRIKKEQLNNIELRKIPYDNPLLKDAEADIVFIANAYHHIGDKSAYFSKVRNGLKPNGELIIVDYFKAEFSEKIQAPPMQMRACVDEVVFELKKAGFSSFEVEVTLLPYQYIIKAKMKIATEFWEQNFQEKQEMWGLDPANSAIKTAEMFYSKGFKKILIPGIGYGRNAQAFIDKEMEVAGIEISATAIAIAQKHYGESIKIYHGSVSDMPFENNQYDGIFSHALIHLLDENERIKLISDCYNQLSNGGFMVFTAITKKSPTYGQGTLVSKDRFAQFGGVNMFFYDEETIQKEFSNYGLVEIKEVIENFPFYMIVCEKKVS